MLMLDNSDSNTVGDEMSATENWTKIAVLVGGILILVAMYKVLQSFLKRCRMNGRHDSGSEMGDFNPSDRLERRLEHSNVSDDKPIKLPTNSGIVNRASTYYHDGVETV